MPDLSGMRFAETHEWVKQDGETATVGISEYAQSQLGDVIYLELPAVGQQLGYHTHIDFVHDGTAAAKAYAGAANTAVITIGTALGVGFPPPRQSLMLLSADFLIKSITR